MDLEICSGLAISHALSWLELCLAHSASESSDEFLDACSLHSWDPSSCIILDVPTLAIAEFNAGNDLNSLFAIHHHERLVLQAALR